MHPLDSLTNVFDTSDSFDLLELVDRCGDALGRAQVKMDPRRYVVEMTWLSLLPP